MQRQTREEIKRSCLRLLEEKPYNQITVRDITESCGVNRNSFYYHFADIPTLISEIIRDEAERLIAEYAEAASLEECFAAASHFARENRRVVLNIYRSGRRDLFEMHLLRLCYDVTASFIDRMSGDIPETERIGGEDRELLLRFCQCELFGQIVLWLENGMDYDVEQQFSRLLRLRLGFSKDLLRYHAEGVKHAK